MRFWNICGPCPECQMEYEALWNTANILENAEAPIPPPELVGNIQQRVRQLHRRRQLAFFANPLAWCFDRLKLEPSPKFVNAIALLFYLVASGFVLKVAFFTDLNGTRVRLNCDGKKHGSNTSKSHRLHGQ